MKNSSYEDILHKFPCQREQGVFWPDVSREKDIVNFRDSDENKVGYLSFPADSGGLN